MPAPPHVNSVNAAQLAPVNTLISADPVIVNVGTEFDTLK